MTQKLTVLAASTHPDDIEIQCAGTLIRYVKEGHKVYMAIACTGNVGSKVHSGPEIEAIRAKEAQRAADLIGAELIMLNYRDGEVWLDNPTWKGYVDLIRQVNPDVILAQEPEDYVHDHSNVGQLAYRAAIWSTVDNIPDTTQEPIDRIPTVFYFEPSRSRRIAPPDYYVDITEEFELKLEAFRQHESQHGDFLEKQFGVANMFEAIEVTNRLRGFQCGCQYAEAFRCVQTWPNHEPNRLLPPVQLDPFDYWQGMSPPNLSQASGDRWK
jgi:LmbE family N-acetylglucosaminyl deacetylase